MVAVAPHASSPSWVMTPYVSRSATSLVLFIAATGGTSVAAPLFPQGRDVVLATTTWVRDAGLLEAILPEFERRSGFRVKVIGVGSGQAMELGRRGEADILVLHDPRGEQEFVRQGYAVQRQALMHNEFVVVGPRSDPAGIKGMESVVTALGAVRRSRSRFISRGDRSGTHVRENMLWEAAHLVAQGDWHLESGQGMSATLQIANELQAYTLTDLGTFLSHRSPLDLDVLVAGDSMLYNPYHVVLPNSQRFPWINVDGGRALLEYLVSPQTQEAIRQFGRARYGRSLFEPDAADRGSGGGMSERR